MVENQDSPSQMKWTCWRSEPETTKSSRDSQKLDGSSINLWDCATASDANALQIMD